MNLLLDTHAFLRAIDDDPRLSKAARAACFAVSFVSFTTAYRPGVE